MENPITKIFSILLYKDIFATTLTETISAQYKQNRNGTKILQNENNYYTIAKLVDFYCYSVIVKEI
jgi:D-alanyl-lipoteichoic acid acyltransferase DltB (MBOAT superfamily)